MPRIRVRDFRIGWFPMGPKDEAPLGSLRRAKGISPLRTQSILSRWGSTLLYAIDGAHSLFTFNHLRFIGAADHLYRNGVSIKAGLNGTRLSFVPMPPQAGDIDSLFIAGGGTLLKVAQDGTVTNWGIAAPPDGFTAALVAQQSLLIDALDSAALWAATSAVLADEATIKQQGTNAMKMTVVASTSGQATKAVVIDLTKYGDGTVSPLEDFITLWVRVDNPANLTNLTVAFDVGAGNFASDYFVSRIDVSSQIPPSTQFVNQVAGAGGNVQNHVFDPLTMNIQGDWVYDDTGQLIGPLSDFQNAGAQVTITTAVGAWVRLRLPKATFTRIGANGNTWANVAAIRLTAETNANGTVIVYWDDIELMGSVGLQGAYQYHVTYKNSKTGSRSNANPTPVTVSNNARQAVTLANLPVSADAQVDTRELWRTVGGGALFFKIDEIADNTTTTYTDKVADYAGLDSRTTTKLMQNIQLPIDNAPPATTYGFAWGPYQTTMWWCGDTAAGGKGRAYYSPPSRPESVSSFIQITNDDDPTQCGLVWGGSNWVFTKAHLFQIVGTAAPFTSQEVIGVPGTSDPFTVVGTPFGIVYQADDGIRLFDGTRSVLITPDRVGQLFLGEGLEGVLPFEGKFATFTRDEYVIGNALEILAVNLATFAWRYYGEPRITALYFEDGTASLIVGAPGSVVIGEDTLNKPTTDAGAAIPFEIEIPAGLVDTANQGILQTLFIEANTNGQVLTPTLILDNTTIVLPSISTLDRETFEWPICAPGRVMGVRLAGSLTNRVEIFGIEADVYIPPVALQRLTQAVKAFQQEVEAQAP